MSVLSYEPDLRKLEELREKKIYEKKENRPVEPSVLDVTSVKQLPKESLNSPAVSPKSEIVNNKVIKWSDEEKILIHWFLSATSLPPETFQLKPGVKICDPQKFYASLREDIATGPKGIRARFGSLQSDLLFLKKRCQRD